MNITLTTFILQKIINNIHNIFIIKFVDNIVIINEKHLKDMTEDVDSSSSKLIKLISMEGHEFFIDKKCAMISGTMRQMLLGQFAESRGEIRFPEIPGVILEKVIQYLYYKVRYTNSQSRVPEFNIEPEIALELLMTSNYLDV